MLHAATSGHGIRQPNGRTCVVFLMKCKQNNKLISHKKIKVKIEKNKNCSFFELNF